jgi:hypothetical protein
MPYATTATSRTRSATASCASRSARRPDDLVGRIADLVEILNGARPGFRTLDAAKLELADALDDRRRLLVIDDAWRVQDLAPFLHRGPRTQTTRLVTTRDERLLPQDARAHRGGRDEDREAQEMLSRFMPTPMPPTLGSRLAALVGSWAKWPLLLSLTNGVVRARMAHGSSATDALAYAERAVAQRGIAKAFQPDDRKSLVSLEQLGADQRTRFAELGVSSRTSRFRLRLRSGSGARRLRSIHSTMRIRWRGSRTCHCFWTSISAAVSCACTTSCGRCCVRVRSRAESRSLTVFLSHTSERPVAGACTGWRTCTGCGICSRI